MEGRPGAGVRPPVAGLFLGLFGACSLTGCASAGPPAAGVAERTAAEQPAPGALLAPTYTAEQADRGAAVYSGACSSCHGANEFKGPIFAMTWMAEPIGHLYEHISTNMPEDRPGSLAPEEYVAVLAHLLRENGRAPGEEELPVDPERLLRIRW